MSTPIFDELLREMAQRAESPAPAEPPQEQPPAPDPATNQGRRRHRAD
jgi:hypothetical protein